MITTRTWTMTHKYDSFGDPILVLAEEAAEVVKECMKASRFGMESPYRITHGLPTSKENLTQEIGDFLVVMEILIRRGILDANQIALAKERKEQRLRDLFPDAL